MVVEVDDTNIEYVVEILNESYRSGRGWTSEKMLVSGDRASKEILTKELNHGYKYYLFMSDQKCIGCFSLFKKDQSVEIGGLCIKPKYQNNGFGKILLESAESMAREISGIQKLILSVLKPRNELIDFYLRRGYMVADKTYPFPVHRGVGKPLNIDLQVVVLEKSV